MSTQSSRPVFRCADARLARAGAGAALLLGVLAAPVAAAARPACQPLTQRVNGQPVWPGPPVAARADQPPVAPARAEDPPAPASAPAFVFEDGAALMAQVPDFTFNFDHPAFYWLIRRIRRHDDPAVFATDENEPRTPWKFLLERPSDYRGRLVVVEGIVRSSLGTRIRGPGREDIGLVHQTELADRGTRGLCTVVTAADTRPAPMNARVRAKGYFLKVRQFGTTAGNVGFAPLVVAHHLEVVAPPVALRRAVAPRGGLTSPENMLLLLTAALAIVWLVLRRATRRRTPRAVSVARRHDVPPPGDAAPTDADFDWLADEPDPAPPDRPDDQMTR